MRIHAYGTSVNVPAKLSVPLRVTIRAALLACAVSVPLASAQGDLQVETITLSESLPSLGRLGGVTVDAAGNIYVANFRATVWKVTPDGTVSALSSSLLGSSGNAIDREGRLLQASFVDGRIVRFEAPGGSR